MLTIKEIALGNRNVLIKNYKTYSTADILCIPYASCVLNTNLQSCYVYHE